MKHILSVVIAALLCGCGGGEDLCLDPARAPDANCPQPTQTTQPVSCAGSGACS